MAFERKHSLLSLITRKTGKGLPPRIMDGSSYRIQRFTPRIEGLFARIERWINECDPADCCWRSISRENITTWYGKSDESRITDPADQTRIFCWLICESHDDKIRTLMLQSNS